MFDSEHKLRHLPFFEEVASHQESDPRWRNATAGLVTLRLVDSWLSDRFVAANDDWSVRSVRAAIECMDEGTPMRSILSRVVDALERQKPDIHVVVTPLMAFGQALEYDAKWHLGADVYQTVLAHLHPVADSDASVAAHLRLGQCFRSLNRVDEAAAAFMAAAEVATVVGDLVGVLRARIGEGKLAILRGNLPHAEEIFDETIRRAVGPDMRDVRSRALHDRANVAIFRGQYEFAIQLAYEALGESQSPTERDRILADIGAAFLDLGVYSAAHDAYVVLSVTAQEQYLRWAAALNLMEIATKTSSEMMFESFRRQLMNEELPPRMATAFQISLGSGYKQFGEATKARTHYERAVALAGEHGFNQMLFQAEEALLALETPPPPLPVPAAVSLDLEEVASAIRQMRETAGAA